VGDDDDVLLAQYGAGRAKHGSGDRARGGKPRGRVSATTFAAGREGHMRRTREGVMDGNTRLLLFKLVNTGVLSAVHGCVKTGKEASVYYCEGGSVALGDGPPVRR